MNNSYSLISGKAAVGKLLMCIALLFCFMGVSAQEWTSVGASSGISAGGASFNNMVKDNAGNLYISYYDVTIEKASVQKFDGTAWTYAGTNAGITTGMATYSSLSADGNGNVYYTNQLGWPGSGMEVRKFDGAAWTQLPNMTNGSVNFQNSTVTPNGTLVAVSNEASGTVKRYVNGTWEQVGTTGFAGGLPYYVDIVAGSDNTVYISYVSGGNINVIQNSLDAAASTAWTHVGGVTGVAPATSSEQFRAALAIDSNNSIYVAYTSGGSGGNKLNVKKYNGTAWSQVGAENFSPDRVHYVNIAVGPDDVPYVVYSTFENAPNNKNTVMKFNGTTWVTVGGETISEGEAKWNTILFDNNGDVIIAYSDSSLQKMVVKKFIADETPAEDPEIVLQTQDEAAAAISVEGGTLQLEAITTPEDEAVLWIISGGAQYATINGTGLVTATGNGTVTVRAAILSNTLIYDEIDIVITNQTIEPETVTVETEGDIDAIINTVGGTLQLIAAILPAEAGQDVTWEITEGGELASINEDGLVTAIGNGTITVTVTSVEDVTKTATITIALSNQSCASVSSLYENFDTLSCCDMGVVPACWNSILVGGASQIISSTQPASGTSQIYQIGYGAGKISIVVLPHFDNINEGTHQFRFKVKANGGPGQLEFGYITDATDAATFEVIESLTISNSSYNDEGAERVLTVPVTVPADARLAIRNPGTTWAGMYWDDVYWEPIAVESVEITTQDDVPAEITANGSALQLEATVNPLNVNQDVVWTITAGSEYATIDENGVVTAVANGTVMVRATSVADETIFDEIEVIISNQNIAVTAIEVSVEEDAEPVITTANGTLQLVAVITPEDATNTNVVWTITTGSEFATIDENGLVTAVANGTVTVRAASVTDEAIFDEIEITINVPTVGVDEFNKNTFTVYPNPVTDVVTIKAAQAVKQVEVYNMMGQRVYTGQQDTVNLSNVQQGVYVVQVRFENGATATQKLIKE